MPKGRVRAVVGYTALTLLCAAATAWCVLAGIAKLNLSGSAVEIRLAECHQEKGGKGGSYTVCSGPVQGTRSTTNARTAKVSYNGHEGETVRAARTPWGSYDVVDGGYVSRSISILLPVVPLLGTAGAAALTVREFRRPRQPAASDGAS
ncbi:hypothetical protein SAMN05216489_06346 [Streptomyces sp. 3213]|uniref:hypothetical protein n=1 Tax=Streptomyces sp. 3213.3 TaxID=1855348 RepID=UPI000896683A|nr:hypothetical protein [Streptomyces sp. 3213.3]SEE36474.1 hypothetical protein SAMN05216489_06346 [Streptomyces sp. 3213] [Streptomyces sp. 3213.3]